METKEKSLILTLPTYIIHTNYWSTGSYQRSSQSSSRRFTRQPRMGMWQVEGLCMSAVRFSQRRLPQTRRAVLHMFLKILRWYTGYTWMRQFHGKETLTEWPSDWITQFGLVMDPWSPQLRWVAKILAVQGYWQSKGVHWSSGSQGRPKIGHFH